MLVISDGCDGWMDVVNECREFLGKTWEVFSITILFPPTN